MMRNIVLFVMCLVVLAGMGTVAVGAAPPEPGPAERPFAAVIEVARPRAAILSSTDGAVENFATPESPSRTTLTGQSVRFLIGAGNEGVWYDQASGTLSLTLEVARQEADGSWSVVGSDEREATETGPHKTHGNLHVDVPFEAPGTYTVRATVITTARPAEQTTDVLIQDRDEVLATINVVDPADLGSISGQVVADEDGRPIPRIKVMAGSEELHVRREARTDQEGRYTVRGLPPGDYFVGVVAEGTPFLGELYDDAHSRDDATPVSVVAGQATPDVNFSLARRPRAETEGQPPATEGGRGEILRRALPAIQELFQGALERFKQLPEGVQAEVRQRVETAVRERLGRGKRPGEFAGPVIRVAEPRAAIAGGVAAVENFAVESGRAVEALARSSAASATSAEEPPAGASVYVPARQPLRFVASTASQAVWFAEGDGRVTLELELFIKEGDEWVSQGNDRQVLSATGPAMRGARLHEDLVFDGPGTYEVMARVTTTATPAGGSPAQDVDEITATVHVVGPEDVGRVSGEVLSEDGAPIAGARVLVIDPAAPRPVATGRSDESGAYTIERVPAGTFVLRAAAPGTPYADEFYGDAASAEEATPVTVEAGGEVTGIGFSLPVGGRISGRVTDEDGNPIANARVEVGNRELGVRRGAKTGEDGAYVVEGLMAGEYLHPIGYRVRAGARGFVPELYDDASDPDAATPVEVSLGEEHANVNFALAQR